MIEHLKKLFALLTKRDKRWLIIILLSMLLVAGLEVVSIGSVSLLISVITNPEILEKYPLPMGFVELAQSASTSSLLVWGGSGFIIIFLIRTGAVILSRYMQVHFAASRQVRLASQLFRSYINAPYTFHLQGDSAELIRNIQTGAMRIGGSVIGQLLSGVQNALLLAAVIMLLLFAEPFATVVSFSLFGVFGFFFIRLTSEKAKMLGHLEMEERKGLLMTLRQVFEGVKEIQVLGRKTFFSDNFTGKVKNIAHTQKNRQMLAFLSAPLMELLAIIALLLIPVVLLSQGKDLAAASATLGMFAVAFVRMKSNFSGMLGSYTNLSYQLVNVDPIYEDLNLLNRASGDSEAEGDGRKERTDLKYDVRFENVSYRYPGSDSLVLNKINLDIPRGTCAGFVGSSGAGKSTLVDILLGVLSPTGGHVLVDGHNIQKSLDVWQQSVGYVPQQVFLLNDTIRRNIALGLRDEVIDDARVERAVERAQLKGFIEGLPKGLDTLVGERGVRLSGGQKQRISIARALYGEPEVLVLDEATAALDNATEQEVMLAIKGLIGEITICIIAHRLSTVEACDSIHILDGGMLRASGTYDYLLDHDYLFKQMVYGK